FARPKNPGTCERSLALLPPGPDAVRNDRSPAGATSLAATAHELHPAGRTALVAAQVVPTRDHSQRHPPAREARPAVPAHDVSLEDGSSAAVLLAAVEDDPAVLGALADAVPQDAVPRDREPVGVDREARPGVQRDEDPRVGVVG